MIKKKKLIDNRLINLQTKVINNLNKLCDFNLDIKFNKVNTNSCFDFKKTKLAETFNFIPSIDNTFKDIPKYKSKIVDLVVDYNQKNLLNDWFNSYIDMYNVVIHYFKNIKTMDTIKNYKLIYDDFKLVYKSYKNIETKKKELIKNKNKITKSYVTLINKTKKTNKDKIKINNITDELKKI